MKKKKILQIRIQMDEMTDQEIARILARLVIIIETEGIEDRVLYTSKSRSAGCMETVEEEI